MKVILVILFLIQSWGILSQQKADYSNYHKSIIHAESLLASENYSDALTELSKIMNTYDFIFLKDIKIATQLAVYLNDCAKAFNLLKQGMQSGWSLKEIKKHKFLAPLKKNPQWMGLIKLHSNYKHIYDNSIDQKLQEAVREMYKNDQKMAWSYLFRIGQRAKEKYANKKIKPQAVKQMVLLNTIMDDKGYPGERLIGEPVWMSTILSHHNSLSKDFVKGDTLYNYLKPRLLKAIKKGELNPYVFAIIEDWRIAVKYDRQKAGFGYITYLKPDQIRASNELRKQVGIRSIGLRNQLVEIQEKTGMDFYLAGSGWVNGKIGEK